MNNGSALERQNLHYLQEQIALGDQKAFRQLFDAYAEKLSRFALAIVKNKDAATEVVDEIFVKIWKQRANVPSIDNMRTYLYTATKNASLNYLARKANEQVTEPFDFINIELQEDEFPDQQMITAEMMKRIHDAVNELPPRCKMIFKLVREDGLKYKEVADILNIKVNTVDAQMVIAVRKISERVKAHFDFFPRPALKKN
jgi:RNA polymerase sigma-70 factor (ECF subfamily)